MRNRNMFQRKEQEKVLNEMEISNLPDNSK